MKTDSLNTKLSSTNLTMIKKIFVLLYGSVSQPTNL